MDSYITVIQNVVLILMKPNNKDQGSNEMYNDDNGKEKERLE